MPARRLPVVVPLLVMAAGLLPAACANGRLRPARTDPARVPPALGTLVADLHPHIARFEAFAVATDRPAGAVAPAVRAAFREALYAGFLDRGYSPLDPAYVDAAGDGVAQPGLTFPVRSMIERTTRAADGGLLVSGWVGLVAPPEPGGEEVTLYLAEIADLAVPPVAGTEQRDGGAETGRRLADALLRRLPPR